MIEIKENLIYAFIKVLGLQRDELEEIQSFKELGISSLNSVRILEEINTIFDLKLPTSIMFECNDLDELVICIESQLKNKSKHAESEKKIADQLHEQSIYIEKNSDNGKVTEYSTYEKNQQQSLDDIAIIGISCRSAGANGQEEFWDLISKGKDCIDEIKDEDWLEYLRINSDKKMPTRYGAMTDIEYFDSKFFHISPKEAQLMDVSQRILLEECYKALEDSGYAPESLKGKQVGTIIGAMGSKPMAEDFSHFSMLGSDSSILAARIAYFLDLKGPSLAVNTACSSSLVAIDIACNKLKANDIDIAISGGITVYTSPSPFISMNNAGMLSPTGECRPFDNAANGIVIGDGVGIVILKRLQDAKRDNDNIYGVIRGIGINQDGRTSGITVPSFISQSELQKSVYKKNHISVEDIQYIETHGTATKLGDPIEIHALNNTFKQFSSQKHFCGIGSLKANIGHTAAASGVLGLIKILLSMKNKQIPPSINLDKENEHIDFENSPFFVNTSLKEWETNFKGSRLAALSAFGFSGTNAHAVIEEYVPDKSENLTLSDSTNHKAKAIIVLSARDEESLKENIYRLLEAIGKQQISENCLVNLEYTLQVGRDAMEERLAVIVDSIKELEVKLNKFVEGQVRVEGLYRGQVKRNKEILDIFDTDEEFQELIDKWIGHEKYEELTKLWVKGFCFDWNKLYKGITPQRISLPTYPFKRELFKLPRLKVQDFNIKDLNSADTTKIQPLILKNKFNSIEKIDKVTLSPLCEEKVSLDNNGVQCSEKVELSVGNSLTDKQSKIDDCIKATPSRKELEEYLKIKLAEVLYMNTDDVQVDEKFVNMGIDSISSVEWIQGINKRYGTSILATKCYEYPSICEFAEFLEKELNKPAEKGVQESLSSIENSTSTEEIASDASYEAQKKKRLVRPEFPELILLNHVSEGRPVFWFHGGSGTVGAYWPIAQKSQRPFYGIQPRGFNTDRSPLKGVQAMAEYYIKIIKSVQPYGPYDLGGYSFAGRLAYEVTRQLQEMGETVERIVMIDSIYLDPANVTKIEVEKNIQIKDLIFRTINTTLLSTISESSEKLHCTLIHRDELNLDVDDETFLKKLIALAKKRGITQTEEQIYNKVKQNVNVQESYQIDEFSISPLPKAQEVSCYYFRNKSGEFFGKLEPYFKLKDVQNPFDNAKYWDEWEKQFPNFYMFEVDASSHIMLLSEPKVIETISEFCENLYYKE